MHDLFQECWDYLEPYDTNTSQHVFQIKCPTYSTAGWSDQQANCCTLQRYKLFFPSWCKPVSIVFIFGPCFSCWSLSTREGFLCRIGVVRAAKCHHFEPSFKASSSYANCTDEAQSENIFGTTSSTNSSHSSWHFVAGRSCCCNGQKSSIAAAATTLTTGNKLLL